MSLTDKLYAILFPNRCCVCRTVIEPERLLCGNCTRHYAVMSKTYTCEICGTDRRRCAHKRLFIERLAPAFFYEDEVRSSVAKFKFRGKPGLAVPYAVLMAQSMKLREFPENIDYITWIPMTARQKRKRGYNQGELLARELSGITGIPQKELLVKLHDTAPQHNKSLLGRHGGLLGVYEVTQELEPEVLGKRILIADDVFTSGQTVNEAAKTLLIFGAEAVFCTSFAMTRFSEKREKKF